MFKYVLHPEVNKTKLTGDTTRLASHLKLGAMQIRGLSSGAHGCCRNVSIAIAVLGFKRMAGSTELSACTMILACRFFGSLEHSPDTFEHSFPMLELV